MNYHRPQTLDEALTLLKEGVPLAGGTSLVPRRRALASVIDLQDLGLDTLEVTQAGVNAGATLPLQTLVESSDGILPALAEACRLEAGWNLRNAATLAGTLMAADGRSPLATVLLALGAQVTVQPGDESLDLDTLWARREAQQMDGLITTVSVPRPRWLAYDQVARSPADRPIVCAAVAAFGTPATSARLGVALGGYGARPVLLSWGDLDPSAASIVDEMSGRASEAYAQAGDAWASAEYRSEIAGILVRRLIREKVTA